MSDTESILPEILIDDTADEYVETDDEPGTPSPKTRPPANEIFLALDTISNVGVDYTQEQFGMVINSTLQTDTPHSCFVYVRAKQTLLMNQQGIEVVS